MSVFLERKPPRPATYGPDGWEDARQWDIEAASALEARTILLRRAGVTRGSYFVDHRGQIPDLSIRCQSITFDGRPGATIGGTGRYIVTAFYSRNRATGDRPPAEPGGTPVYWVDASTEAAPADMTIEGWPIENTVEEPIDPPLTPYQSREILNVEWHIKSDDAMAVYAVLRPYRNKLNSATWHGATRGCFRCQAFNASPPDNGYVKVIGRFEYHAPQYPARVTAFYTPNISAVGWGGATPPIDGWASIVMLRGRRKLVGLITDPVNERYQPIVDADGKPINDPVPITSSGVPITDGSTYALVFYHYEYADFSELSL